MFATRIAADPIRKTMHLTKKDGFFKENIIAARMLALTNPVQELVIKKGLEFAITKLPAVCKPKKEAVRAAMKNVSADKSIDVTIAWSTKKITKNFIANQAIFLLWGDNREKIPHFFVFFFLIF
jgi:hypothetical protein